MKHAETVTFGGSGLDRAAHLRGTDGILADPNARSILVWRGKILVKGAQLAYLPMTHALITPADQSSIFLGQDETGPLWAHDISMWEPEGYDSQSAQQFLDGTLQQHPLLPNDYVFAELRAVMTHLSPRDAELAATARALFAWHETHGFCAACGAQSEMKMHGWQRTCPDCQRSHFPRTDPVVIMLVTHDDHLLLGRSPGWPDGMYSLLAGFVEPGETMEAAVRREVFEESGVMVGAVSYLASQPWPFPASLMFGCHGEGLSTQITVDPVELEAALWLSRADVECVVSGTHPTINPMREGAIAHFLVKNWLSNTLE
jgi:NAD+ diphosphatase